MMMADMDMMPTMAMESSVASADGGAGGNRRRRHRRRWRSAAHRRHGRRWHCRAPTLSRARSSCRASRRPSGQRPYRGRGGSRRGRLRDHRRRRRRRRRALRRRRDGGAVSCAKMHRSRRIGAADRARVGERLLLRRRRHRRARGWRRGRRRRRSDERSRHPPTARRRLSSAAARRRDASPMMAPSGLAEVVFPMEHVSARASGAHRPQDRRLDSLAPPASQRSRSLLTAASSVNLIGRDVSRDRGVGRRRAVGGGRRAPAAAPNSAHLNSPLVSAASPPSSQIAAALAEP